ncbi:MAG: transglutaminase domain-containing protein [Faecousia sp.]
MKQRIGALLLALSLLLTGCGWMDGRYSSVTPHQEQRQSPQSEVVVASDYLDLMDALEEMIRRGSESGVINVAEYPTDAVESGMAVAVRYAMETYPVGAYSVDHIDYEVGANGGLPAVAVTIAYRHSPTEIRMIRQVSGSGEAETEIVKALKNFDAGVVLLVEDYTPLDFTQLVRDYAEDHPETVMEIPQVTAAIHGTGTSKVAELTFTYQTSRDSLRQMQSQVKPVFDAAALYVSGDGEQKQKFSQLYAFLMERFDYKIETSITPAYSLLRHGVGDSRAFATVYAAMCRLAGLECMTVTGTHAGEPWTWNIVLDNGRYYHVDLLRCSEAGGYREFTDREMSGYVWDYSAYPQCPGVSPNPSEETEPVQETAEQTVPEGAQPSPGPLPPGTATEEMTENLEK